MVGIGAAADSTKISIFGHGLRVAAPFELKPGVWITSDLEKFDAQRAADNCASFTDYAASIHGSGIATFCIEVVALGNEKNLAVKGWNSLWLFHLLAVASEAPCLMLYAKSDGTKPVFSAVAPTPIAKPFAEIVEVPADRLLWASSNADRFDRLVDAMEFATSMRCYANAFYLLDDSVRIMLLWAGIEGLLAVDAELSRRLALHSAVLIEGTAEEKGEFFDFVKKAYGLRSRAVHGGKLKPEQLAKGRQDASHILIRLLRRCVELGRVPSAAELDRLAAGSNVK